MALGITSIFGEKRPILCVTEKKNTKKAIPYGGLPKSVWVGICQNSKWGVPKPVRGSFQFVDQQIHSTIHANPTWPSLPVKNYKRAQIL